MPPNNKKQTEKANRLGADMDAFERLPDATKELNNLMEKAEKATGTESNQIEEAIRKKSK